MGGEAELQILIAVPTYDGRMHCRLVQAIERNRELAAQAGIATTFAFYQGQPADYVRNEACKDACLNGFDALWMIDEDTIPPDNALKSLWHRDVPIVAAVVASRHEAATNAYEQHDKENSHFHYFFDKDLINRPGVYEASGSGVAACGLVRTDALRQMAEYWGPQITAKPPVTDYRHPWFEWYIMRDTGERAGEDLIFCKKAREAGIKIYVDSAVLCAHIGSVQCELLRDRGYGMKLV